MDIAEMRARPHLSASSIKAYVDCGLFYKFSRIDKLKPAYVSDNLLFGSTIHQVMAIYNEEKIVGNRLSLEEMNSLFEKYWTEATDNTDRIQYSKGKNFESLLEQGKQLMRTYVSKAPKDEFMVLAVEEPFQFTIEGMEEIAIIGVMDLVEQDEENTVIISDYKTMSSSTVLNEIDQNFQLTVYHMAARRNGYADREIVLKLDCLIKTKEPRFEQVYTYRNEEHEHRAVRKIKEVWNGIQKGIFIPNAEGTWRCNYCEYKTYCDDWFMT